MIATVLIKSAHPESQGPYVVINETDYDPKLHEIFEQKVEKAKTEKTEKAAKGDK